VPQTSQSSAFGRDGSQTSSITEVVVTLEEGSFSYFELATGRTLTANAFVRGINSRAGRRNAAPWVSVLGFAAALMLVGIPLLAAGVFITTLILAIVLNRNCQRSRQTHVDYRLDSARESACRVLQDGVTALSGANAVWRVAPDSTSFVNTRTGAQAGSPQTPWIQSNVAVPGITATSESFHFFPDQFLIWTRGMYAPISYADLKVELQTVDVAETNRQPADSAIVGQTWKHAKRDGGPDRRYRDNPVIPIVRYALVTLRADQYRLGILVSSYQQAEIFASALRAFVQCAANKPAVDLRAPAAETPRMPSRWVPEHETVALAGFQIPGFIYFGRNLSSLRGHGPDPALIDPSLPVASSSAGFAPGSIPYWPSYSKIEPAARHACLCWHASGRADPDAPISFVFLYFYGLERRVLCDYGTEGLHDDEYTSILAEVKRLLSIYRANDSFQRYASAFLEFAEAVRKWPEISGPPPEVPELMYELPASLKIGLGLMAREGRPVPPAWARVWAVTDPAFHRRTSFVRCREHFNELFDLRYRERFGEGVILKPNRTRLRIEYRPASASFGSSVVAKTDLSDVTVSKEPVGTLRTLAEECSEELASFSRYVGRNPEGAKDVAALALLPPVLVSHSRAEHVRQLRDKLAAAAGPGALLHREDLLNLVEFQEPGGLSKREAVALAQVLASAGFGIEPDIRFGGAVPAANSRVFVFPLIGDAAGAPTPEYSAATLLIHLAALVAAADGSIREQEQTLLENHVAVALNLSDGERLRLDAHLRRALAERPGLGGVKKRIEALAASQREAIGRFLIGVANADGYISPEEMQSLGKMYRMLGLNQEDVYSHAHAAATEPITVESPQRTAPGFTLPPRPSAKPEGIVRLEVVKAKLRETAAVSALLAPVFADEAAPPPVPAANESGAIAGLDTNVSAFVRLLATKPTWTREELEDAAEKSALLLDGTIDVINDASFDACDEAALEGEDPVEVNIALLTGLMERTVTT
jgi:tellurite resistance protein